MSYINFGIVGDPGYYCDYNIKDCIYDETGTKGKIRYGNYDSCMKYCSDRYTCLNNTCTLMTSDDILSKPNLFYNDSTCGGNCDRYTCSENGSCIKQQFGPYINESDCKTHCKWACENGTCIPKIDGEFTSEDECKNDCPNKYICEKGSCVRKYDKSIDETRQDIYIGDSNCGGRCKNYSCTKQTDNELSSCVLNDKDVNSTPNENCKNECINKYFCNRDGTCEPRTDGYYYNQLTCENSCNRWSCFGSKCEITENGEYTTQQECENDCPNKYECNKSNCERSKPGNGKYLESNCQDKCNKYSCTSNGECVLTEGGNYSSSNCDEKCKRYSCLNNTCILTEGGDYLTPDCDKNCPKYECDDNGGCIAAPVYGTYSDKNECDDKCQYVYSCLENQCVKVKAGTGLYKEPKCNGVCPRYKCANDGTCQPAPGEGEYTTSNCDKKCEVVKRYKCLRGGGCVEDPTGQGPFINPGCDGQCEINLKRYKCLNNECIEDAEGKYTYPNCNNECGKKYHCNRGVCEEVDNPSDFVGIMYDTSDCNGKCTRKYKCNGDICEETTDENAPYNTGDCNDECKNPKYSCKNNTCIQIPYGEYSSTEECQKECQKKGGSKLNIPLIFIIVGITLLLGFGIFWYSNKNSKVKSIKY